MKNIFDQLSALAEFERLGRREQMMEIDVNALMRQQELLSNTVAYEAWNNLSRNPSYKWAMEGAVTSPLTEAARIANLSAVGMLNNRLTEIERANYEELSRGWNDRVRHIEAASGNALKDWSGRTSFSHGGNVASRGIGTRKLPLGGRRQITDGSGFPSY